MNTPKYSLTEMDKATLWDFLLRLGLERTSVLSGQEWKGWLVRTEKPVYHPSVIADLPELPKTQDRSGCTSKHIHTHGDHTHWHVFCRYNKVPQPTEVKA